MNKGQGTYLLSTCDGTEQGTWPVNSLPCAHPYLGKGNSAPNPVDTVIKPSQAMQKVGELGAREIEM